MDKLISFAKDNGKYLFILVIILVSISAFGRFGTWITSLFRGWSRQGDSVLTGIPDEDMQQFLPQNPTFHSTLTLATARIVADRAEQAMSGIRLNERQIEEVLDRVNFTRDNARLVFEAFGERRYSLFIGRRNLRFWIDNALSSNRLRGAYGKWNGFLRLAHL